MQSSSGGVPHIPDDWSRDIARTGSKTTSSKKKASTNTTTCSTKQPPNATTATPVKKRKRNVIDSAVTNTTPVTSEEISESKSSSFHASANGSETPSTTVFVEPSTSSQRHNEETQSVMRGLFHQVEKLARRPGCALAEGIYLDSIMTHIPYKDVLEQMFGGNAITDSACVPVVTRAYEESYMREILNANEQSCIMGSNCECQFIDEHNPFIGVQFTLPVDAFCSSATPTNLMEELSSNKLCVLCCRKNTQSLFYEALYNHRTYSSCIQLYGNICDRPGEYAKDAMLICPLSGPIQNMPLPLVAHQRNRYSVIDYNGIRQLRQHRVAYEDFHLPSSSRC